MGLVGLVGGVGRLIAYCCKHFSAASSRYNTDSVQLNLSESVTCGCICTGTRYCTGYRASPNKNKNGTPFETGNAANRKNNNSCMSFELKSGYSISALRSGLHCNGGLVGLLPLFCNRCSIKLSKFVFAMAASSQVISAEDAELLDLAIFRRPTSRTSADFGKSAIENFPCLNLIMQ